MSAHSQAEIPDGEPVDAQVIPEAPISLEVARRERRSEVIQPLDPAKLIESFRTYQAMLPQLLNDTDYQAVDGKKFVKKSGWLKIARAFDLDTELAAPVQIDRDENGKPIRAQVWIRAIAPSGAAMVGDGYCSIDEDRFKNDRGRKKLEHDLPSTAATRARNRAISNLVGMGEVSAEEVSAGEQPAAPEHPYGPPLAGKRNEGITKSALVHLVGPAAVDVWDAIEHEYGYMPRAAAHALAIAWNLHPDAQEATAV